MKKDSFITNKYKLKESVIDSFARRDAGSEHLEWWIDREEEIEKWNAIINKAIKSSTNFIQFIIGNYGRGKTLSLLRITYDQKENDLIFSAFLNLKGEEKSTPGLDLILRIFRNVDFDLLSSKTKKEDLKTIINSLPEVYSELRSVLWKIYFGSLNSESINLFTSEKKIPRDSTRDLAINFIQGLIAPSPSQLKELGIQKKLDKIDVAKEYLGGLLYFMRKLGHKTFLICIDEFESLFSLVTKSQQSTYIALLRSLYDFPQATIDRDNTANMIFFIGISEAGWDSLKDMQKKESMTGGPTVPLLERLENPIVLTSFNEPQTEELIEKRLKFNRVSGKFENDPLIPFTEDFVNFIFKITNGEPRQILIRTSHVLDAGLAEKVIKLDANFAKKILKERGFEIE